MPNTDLFPVAGIDNVSNETSLVVTENRQRKVFVRDALNLDIWEEGDITLRPGLRKVTNKSLSSLWHSTVHNDNFAVENGMWVRLDRNWESEPLVEIGNGEVHHIELNQKIYAAGARGIFTFNGVIAESLTLPEPDAPIVQTIEGSFVEGEYGFAIAWLRGDMESPLSFEQRLTVIGGVSVIVPMCFDLSVTGVRIYATQPNSGELARVGDYPITTVTIDLPTLPSLGKAPAFRHKDPMPTGKYLRFWRGRLLTATGRRINFSDALAYHIHDPRHGFIDMPQRVTFIEPVNGGIWVGQIDHVCFLRGEDMNNLEMLKKTQFAPVPGSSGRAGQEVAGEAAIAGDVAVWLADNGYVIGTTSGEVQETGEGHLSGVKGSASQTVVRKNRVITLTLSV